MPDCRRMILHYAYLIRKKHHPRSNLVQINGSIDGNVSNGNSVNYFDENYSKLTCLYIYFYLICFYFRRRF